MNKDSKKKFDKGSKTQVKPFTQNIDFTEWLKENKGFTKNRKQS